MFRRLTVLPRLLAVLGLLMLAASIGASSSQAATQWGDLGHFADKAGELKNAEQAFGIDSEDGSTWVVDTTVVGEEEVFRIQKFEQSGGTWKVVASRTFGHVETEDSKGNEITHTAEGVAFDPAKKRAYVLVSEERSKNPDKEEQAAAELWAFSTTTNGSKIEPATGVSGGLLVERTEEVLKGGPVGQTKFAPQDTEAAQSLDVPGGITVNPTNHQILITGWVGSGEDQNPQMWAISEAGKIESVWEAKAKAFEPLEKCGCMNSPVVTSTGRILVLGDSNEEIYEVPSSLNSSTPAKRAFWMPTNKFECETLEREKAPEPCPFVEKLTAIETGSENGGEMSIGSEGNIYAHLKIPDVAQGGSLFGGVLVLGSKLEELGWTGGGSSASETRACAVNESGEGNGGPAMVAASKEGVYMFERGEPGAEQSKVLELGPGGAVAGCPKATATAPKATAGGSPLTSFPISDKITFSSTVTQGNALFTEWEFEPGLIETVSKRQQETTLAEHKFAKEGKFKVLEKIHTDDLATPVIETSVEVTITGPPKVEKEEAVVEGTGATLKAEVNPNNARTTCEFQYGIAGESFGSSGIKKVACPETPIEGAKPVKESIKVTGLQPGSKYHFRVVATAGENKVEPTGTEFALAEAGAPEAETLSATGVGVVTATLNGKVNPEGVATKACKFEYGTTTSYGKEAACSPSPGAGSVSVAVSAALNEASGLANNTPYHFRIVDENANGKKTIGLDKEFKTLPKLPPSAETLGASGVSQTNVTITGSVDPKGEPTSCKFLYGPTASYGKEAPCANAPGSGNAAVAVSASISGLSANTVYHYKLIAESAAGKAEGTDAELKTLETPVTGGGGGGGTPTTTTTATTTTGAGEVRGFTEASPVVSISGSTLTVASSGGFSLKLSCPAGATQCAGTITLKTLTAVTASVHAGIAKKSILTLASGSFTIAGGKLKLDSLHLSAKAKQLLAKLHTVRARVTIVAHNPQGAAHTTSAVVTLKAAKKKH